MYLEVNQTIEEAINLIKEKIRTNTPFALSRYGDGEIYCRYQILHTFNKTIIETSNLILVSNPDYNIFLGMDIDLKNWIDNRINELR